jgi:hypothetical protein
MGATRVGPVEAPQPSADFERRAAWLRGAWEAFHRRREHAAFFNAYHPRTELYVSESAVETGTYRGRIMRTEYYFGGKAEALEALAR